jgi:hypothetical protein
LKLEEQIILEFLNWCEANDIDVLQFTQAGRYDSTNKMDLISRFFEKESRIEKTG